MRQPAPPPRTAASNAGSCAYQISGSTCGEVHLFSDELGDPVHPASYSDRFKVLVHKAGLPRIRLQDTRHTCGP